MISHERFNGRCALFAAGGAPVSFGQDEWFLRSMDHPRVIVLTSYPATYCYIRLPAVNDASSACNKQTGGPHFIFVLPDGTLPSGGVVIKDTDGNTLHTASSDEIVIYAIRSNNAGTGVWHFWEETLNPGTAPGTSTPTPTSTPTSTPTPSSTSTPTSSGSPSLSLTQPPSSTTIQPSTTGGGPSGA